MLILLGGVAVAQAEFRIWESTDGDIWEGEFVTMTAGLVVVQDQFGEKSQHKLISLSAADQEYLEERLPPSLNLDVSRSADTISSGSEMMHCVATIKKSSTQPYKGELTAVLVILAEEQRTGAISKAGATKEFKFTLPEKYSEPIQFESKPYKFMKSSKKSGRAYYGYVLVVWDRFGNPIAVKSNRDSYAEKAARIARPKPTLNQ
ncbi:MAG: hypothetical protein V5783_06590 [Pontiella sp.]